MTQGLRKSGISGLRISWTGEGASSDNRKRLLGHRKKLLFSLAAIVIIVTAVATSSYMIEQSTKNAASRTLIGMEYETWFPYPMGWGLREATPILGTYSSSDPAVIRQQAEWLTWAGVNFLIIDWSNNVWQSSPPSKDNWHNRIAFAIINSTSALLMEYHLMTQMGLPHPK
ncbi:MAG: hypothetical protein ACP5T2_07005, partial [Thermoprotei archaeon]